MADPRMENAQQFRMENNKVAGVELTHIPFPESKWKLVRASLIDEMTAQGQTVARVIVRDKDGIEAQVPCFLGFPWKGWSPGDRISNHLLPGNTNFPYEHIVSNKFDPEGGRQGPLSIFIGDAHGNVESDLIGGLGLPKGHHVSYHLVFQERNGDSPVAPPPSSDDEQGETAPSTLQSQLDRIEQKIERIAQHFGLENV